MNKNEKMFCFQCEQTAGGKGCSGGAGVCGKPSEVANLQDELTGALIGFARAAKNNEYRLTSEMRKYVLAGLFTTITNVNFDTESVIKLTHQVQKLKEELFFSCLECRKDHTVEDYNMKNLWHEEDEDIRSLKAMILFGIRGMSAYAYHAEVLGYDTKDIVDFMLTSLWVIGKNGHSKKKLLEMVLDLGEENLRCMELLDKANTETYGSPSSIEVSRQIEPGPFIVVSGHDLHDLKQILEQTEGTGVNVYTHGEMLPAQGYPQLRRYSHLRGNIGSAWQNQRAELDGIPAPVLFTTNCIMPPLESYKDRVFTSGVVFFPGTIHIGSVLPEHSPKDFGKVIVKALELGGYSKEEIAEQKLLAKGKATLSTGWGWRSVLGHANEIVEGVKQGKISGFYLVGGCDGAKPGRNFYTEYVENLPNTAVILTLACGKYRINNLDLGVIKLKQDESLLMPRLIDLGQCNDAYGAIKIVFALAEAFKCNIDELPLHIELSWYEQKAVAVLLTLLSLGIENIHLGPSAPAFASPEIARTLGESFALKIMN